MRDETNPLLGIPSIIQELSTEIGDTLLSVLAGIRDSNLPREWREGVVDPTEDEEVRMRLAYQVWRDLVDAEGPDTARLWLVGRNPVLEQPPAIAIREDRLAEVRAAADGFIAGTWSL